MSRNLIDRTIVRWQILKADEHLNQDVFEYHTQKSHLLPTKCFRIRRSWSIGGPLPSENQTRMTNSTFYASLPSIVSSESETNDSAENLDKSSSNKDVFLKEEGDLYNACYFIRALPNKNDSIITVSIAADLR